MRMAPHSSTLAWKIHGWRSLVVCGPWGREESDTTEQFHFHFQMVKNLPAMQETRVRSLSQEDLLEKGLATHSSILAWRIPCIEEPGGLQSTGLQRVEHD